MMMGGSNHSIIALCTDYPFRSAAGSRTGTGLRVLSDFQQGQVVAGRVKRVEKFGVFLELDGSNVVGALALVVGGIMEVK